jgi:hypothetical protein
LIVVEEIASHSMDISDEFSRYAANCAEMEQLARDPASKAEWRKLADKWQRRAKQFMRGLRPGRFWRKRSSGPG